MAAERDEVRIAHVLARLGIVCELFDLDIGELVALSGLVSTGFSREVTIALGGRFDELTLEASVPPAPERDGLLAELARRSARFGANCASWLGDAEALGVDSFIELRQGGGDIEIALRSELRQPLAAVLAVLADRAPQPAACERLFSLLADHAVGGHLAVAITTRLGRGDDAGSASVWCALGREPANPMISIADTLAIPEPQRQLLADLHPILRTGGGYRFALTIADDHVVPELEVVYPNVDTQVVLRLLAALNPDAGATIGENVGKLAGALGGADHVRFLHLTLTPIAPRVTLAFSVA